MKTISLALSGILAVAVAILFYQVTSLKSQLVGSLGGQSEAKVTDVNAANIPGMPNTNIAYVNSDSINEKYAYISDVMKEINGQRRTLEASYQSLATKLQSEYTALQESAQSGIMPQAEVERKAADLERQRQELGNKQLQMDQLADKMAAKSDELHDKVEEFLKRFNNGKYDYILSYSKSAPHILLANPKLEITKQVIEGLNKEYAEEKAKKASDAKKK